jgi:hypothetical protein
MDQDLFGALRREWAACCRTPAASRAFSSLAAIEPAIATCGATDLAGLVASLDRRSSTAATEPWTVIAALVRRLEVSELFGLGILVCLIPTMARIGERLSWGRGGPWADHEEFVGELVSVTWAAISSLAGADLSYPVHAIRRRVLGRLQRQRDRAIASRTHEVPTLFDALEDPDQRGSTEAEVYRRGLLADEHPVPVLDSLAKALCSVDEAVIDRKLVQLVYARRVLGYPLREVSALIGEPEDVVEYQEGRAEALLCAS